MTVLRVNTLSGIGTGGPVFDGELEFNSQNYVILPKGTTSDRVGVGSTPGALRYNTDSNKVELYDGSQWTEVQASRPDLNGGARGVFGGGEAPSPVLQVNTIDYITISTTGNALDFGDLTLAKNFGGGCSSSTRGLFGGAWNPSNSNVIDYVTISSTGNATDFGDLSVAREQPPNLPSSSTRGIFAGGASGPTPAVVYYNVIEYVTIASTGNAVDFGDLSSTRYGESGCSSSIRGVFGGGGAPLVNTIEFITISTLGNATDFGDLTQARNYCGAVSNSIRGLWGGGQTPTITNIIDFVTISSLGNAVRFGDLTASRVVIAGCSSPTRGAFAGGNTPTYQNVIDYVTIMSVGNAIDFGDLTQSRSGLAGLSNAHGGL